MQRDARAFDHQVLDSYVKPGMTVVDVGANIGALTVHASRLAGSTGHVIAFEAHPTTYRYLTGNIRLNACTNVDARNVAVGAQPGVTFFSDFAQDDINHVVDRPGDSQRDPMYGRPRSQGVEVRVDTMDKLLHGRRADFLKIDVEGYEKFVLEGGTVTLANVECVYIESFEREFAKYGYHNRDVLELLQRAGLSIFRYDGRAWKLIGMDHVSETVENLLAVRDPSLARKWSG
jgi:FkbM family methyltransferase